MANDGGLASVVNLCRGPAGSGGLLRFCHGTKAEPAC